MHVSRCRYWWCPRCQAAYEKEDLAAVVRRLDRAADVSLLGTRTCWRCGAAYLLGDIYAGKHDVPQWAWGKLRPPVELSDHAVAPGTDVRLARPPLLAWWLLVLALGGVLALFTYAAARPFLEAAAR